MVRQGLITGDRSGMQLPVKTFYSLLRLYFNMNPLPHLFLEEHDHFYIICDLKYLRFIFPNNTIFPSLLIYFSFIFLTLDKQKASPGILKLIFTQKNTLT